MYDVMLVILIDRLIHNYCVLTYICATAMHHLWLGVIRGCTQIMLIPFYGEFSIVLQHKPCTLTLAPEGAVTYELWG